jgi:hypothetical protein
VELHDPILARALQTNCASLDANQRNAVEALAFATDPAVDDGDPALAAYDDSGEPELLLHGFD